MSKNSGSIVRIRKRNLEMPPEPARTEQRGINLVGEICGADGHDASSFSNSVEMFEQRIHDLARVLFVLAGKPISASNRVEFVEEEKTWSIVDRLIKGSAHCGEKITQMTFGLPSCEGMRKQWNATALCQDLYKQGFSCSGRAADECAVVDIRPRNSTSFTVRQIGRESLAPFRSFPEPGISVEFRCRTCLIDGVRRSVAADDIDDGIGRSAGPEYCSQKIRRNSRGDVKGLHRRCPPQNGLKG